MGKTRQNREKNIKQDHMNVPQSISQSLKSKILVLVKTQIWTEEWNEQ